MICESHQVGVSWFWDTAAFQANLCVHSPQGSQQSCFVLPCCGCCPERRAMALGTALATGVRLCHCPWDSCWLATGKSFILCSAHFCRAPGSLQEQGSWCQPGPVGTHSLCMGLHLLHPCLPQWEPTAWGCISCIPASLWHCPEGCQRSSLLGFLPALSPDNDAALTPLCSVRVPRAAWGFCSSGRLAEGGGMDWGGSRKPQVLSPGSALKFSSPVP